MKTLILILLLAFSAHAQSDKFDEWTFIAQGLSEDGAIHAFIAPKSIARDGDKIKVWVQGKAVWGRPFRKSSDWINISYVRIHGTFDCKAHTARGDEVVVYNEFGDVLLRKKINEKIKERSETIGWMAFEYFCEGEGKRLTTPPTLK